MDLCTENRYVLEIVMIFLQTNAHIPHCQKRICVHDSCCLKGFAMSTEEDTEKEWQKQRVKGWRSSASEEGEQKEEAQNETHPRGQRERVKTLSTG